MRHRTNASTTRHRARTERDRGHRRRHHHPRVRVHDARVECGDDDDARASNAWPRADANVAYISVLYFNIRVLVM
jgi:hypothetical protein